MYAMRGQKRFKKEYIEIPGYPPKTKKHRANFIRRSLLMKKKWEGSAARAVQYPDGIAIAGIDTPIVELAGPGKLYVEIGMASRQGKDFTVELFITGPKGAHASWPLLPGYDGWLPVSEWKKGEIFHGKYSLRLPTDLPEGPYSFGILVRDAEEQALFPVQTPGGVSVSEPYVLAEGEVNFGSTFTVIPRDDAKDLAHKTRKMAMKAAANGQCEKGEQLWNLARLRRIENYKWAKKYRPSAGRSIAICWAEKASETESMQTQLEYIRRGREWNHKSDAIQALGEVLGDSWFAQGLEAQQAEDWETAFQAFLQAVAADPRNAWARRYAEEARAQRLTEE